MRKELNDDGFELRFDSVLAGRRTRSIWQSVVEPSSASGTLPSKLRSEFRGTKVALPQLAALAEF